MRKDFGPQTWMFPMPVLIIGTYNEEGKPNAMNAAWGGIYDYNQIMICLSSHQTTDNIRKSKAFTISFATVDTVTASDYVGIVSQKDEPNKIEKAGLKVEKAKNVNAPIFTNYPLALECELVEVFNEGEGGGNFVGKIVNVSADESILTNGKVDYKKLKPLAFDPTTAKYIVLGDEVAQAFKEGIKAICLICDEMRKVVEKAASVIGKGHQVMVALLRSERDGPAMRREHERQRVGLKAVRLAAFCKPHREIRKPHGGFPDCFRKQLRIDRFIQCDRSPVRIDQIGSGAVYQVVHPEAHRLTSFPKPVFSFCGKTWLYGLFYEIRSGSSARSYPVCSGSERPQRCCIPAGFRRSCRIHPIPCSAHVRTG